MANSAPATITTSLPTGPGQALSAVKFTDVNEIQIDFLRNVMRIIRAGAGGTVYCDYAACTTFSASITSGATSITFS